MNMKTILLAASITALAGTPALAVQAAGQASTPPQPPAYGQAQASADFSDEQLWNYVRAVHRVDEIIGEYQPRVQAAQSEEAAAEVQQEAQEVMISALEEEGISPSEYNQINAVAQQDAQLAQRLTSIAEEYQANQDG